ncbi:SDR family oxidoreductase [Nocardioides nanhaiensis]|uniref:SDR family oxidoreductase n=1 Tax=Nocardioides nanhaiensis TaxID=1476871 RepID=A0ABP8X4C2_9ACTN
MELEGARTLVVGAGGGVGAPLSRALVEAGARVVGTGRDPGSLDERVPGLEAVLALDLLDVTAARAAVDEAAERLGGLDVVVVASGIAGFGAVEELDDAVAEQLVAVDLLGPMTVCSAALAHLADPGQLVVLSAILADQPMAGMAAYSATKAGLSGFLQALRKEVRRRHVGVLDVRPPHMETGLADRAIAGEPPRMPAGYDVDAFVELVLRGMREDSSELVWDPREKGLVLR